MDDDKLKNRRPLASRSSGLARRAAARLTRSSVTPDQISAWGIVFAALAGMAFASAPQHAWLWLVGAVGVQLRLACNLLDGMVAVEGGRGSAYGPLWNEAPDRIEDTLILVGFGFGAGAPQLGLWAAIAALFCAYVRVLGGALGQPQSFAGPMAKQHRMAAITGAAVLAFGAASLGVAPWIGQAALALVFVGTLYTCWRRIRIVARGLLRP